MVPGGATYQLSRQNYDLGADAFWWLVDMPAVGRRFVALFPAATPEPEIHGWVQGDGDGELLPLQAEELVRVTLH